MTTIRHTSEADLESICDLHRAAFGETEGPEIVDLIRGLFDDATALPLLSLAAEEDGKIVGHVLFTCVGIEGCERDVKAQILAPLAVSPTHQKSGVGGSLIREGLEQLAAAGVDLVFVLGHPGYYPRFGFRPAGCLGLSAPYPIPAEHEDAWMVQELRAAILERVKGTVQCADVLSRPQYW
jgi:predicted N-acetyltransferase YhbS